MKGLTRKIFTSVLALVLTGVALGTGVFAWFTINNTAVATGFGGSVESASGGFMVSKNGSGWTTNLSLADVVDEEFRFTDLTTTDLVTFRKLDGDTSTEGFVSFDLYFAAGAYTDIEATLEITSNETTWTSDHEGKPSFGETFTNRAANAIRVGFLQNDVVTRVFENVADSALGNKVGIGATYEDNAAVGYYNEVNPGVINDSNFGKVSVDGTLTDIYVAAAANQDKMTTVPANVAVLTDTLPAGFTDAGVGYSHYAKVTVKVWIEGFDQEAYNAILNGLVTVNFSFKAVININ